MKKRMMVSNEDDNLTALFHNDGGVLLLSVMFLALVGALSLLFFYAIPAFQARQRAPQVVVSARVLGARLSVAPEKPPLSKQEELPASPAFDFYTLLPQVDSATALVTPGPTLGPPGQGSYALQLAALSSEKSAIQFRDQLALLGYRAFVQRFQMDKREGFRVLIGPFVSLALAETHQQRLDKQNLNSILIKKAR